MLRVSEKTLLKVSEKTLPDYVRALGELCPHIATLIATQPLPPLRLREGGFLGLLRIIVFQQISIAAGNAIWAKFEAAVPSPSPEKIAKATEESLQAAGLSRPKIRTMKALADALLTGLVTQANLDGENTAQLLTVKGIGPWSVQIYDLSCLGLADSWPAGDIALQEAIKDLFALETRPSAQEITVIAQRWQPYRALAARLLWANYTQKRTKKEMQP